MYFSAENRARLTRQSPYQMQQQIDRIEKMVNLLLQQQQSPVKICSHIRIYINIYLNIYTYT